jgi:hypothetical protein
VEWWKRNIKGQVRGSVTRARSGTKCMCLINSPHDEVLKGLILQILHTNIQIPCLYFLSAVNGGLGLLIAIFSSVGVIRKGRIQSIFFHSFSAGICLGKGEFIRSLLGER